MLPAAAAVLETYAADLEKRVRGEEGTSGHDH